MQATSTLSTVPELHGPRLTPGLLGHIFIVTCVSLFGAAMSIGGEPELMLVFTLPFVIGAAVSLWLAKRFQHKGNIAGLVYGILGLALLGPEIVHIADHPDSFFDFVPLVAGLGGGLILTASSVAALARRPFNGVAAQGVAWAAAGLFVVIAGISGAATIAARETVSAEDKIGATEFAMKSVKFETKELRVRSGEELRLVVDNTDPIIHTFTIKGLGIDEEVRAGSERLVKFVAPAAGTYEIICAVPGHESMKSKLIVE